MGKATSTKKSSETSALDEIGGYKVLPVYFEDSATPHTLYFKQHNATKENPLTPAKRTIYMFNLPVDTTERDIRRLLQGVARVSQVWFHDIVGQDIVKSTALEAQLTKALSEATALASEKNKNAGSGGGRKRRPRAKQSATADDDNSDEIDPAPRSQLLISGAGAHVVLLEEAEMDTLLSMKKARRAWPARTADDESDPRMYLGLSRYMYEYRAARPPTEMLKKDVDLYMSKFEKAQYERERMLEQQRNVPDEDGFITVVRQGRKNKNTDGTATVVATSARSAMETAKKTKEVSFGNMYRFQMREKKRDQLVELRKKFEEDKDKIARLRQNRHFRPY